MGTDYGSHSNFEGEISNVRIIKGTGLYTSSFKPPTEPLTNVTNTKLLCCNNSSVTGSTVAPGTITTNENPTASTDSPFDDPAGSVFGDGEDQNVIKCGSYVGNGSSTAPLSGLSQTPHLRANAGTAEQDTSYYRIDISSGTGFAPFTTDNGLNGDGDEYIYIAIRRPDPYVAKPFELSSELFRLIETRGGTQSNPNSPAYSANTMRNGLDFVLTKTWWTHSSENDWKVAVRLLGGLFPETNDTAVSSSIGHRSPGTWKWDYNSGFATGPIFTDNTGSPPGTASLGDKNAWIWKRSAGFDAVVYSGSGANNQFTFGDTPQPMDIPHNLTKTPEFIWVKRLDSSADSWSVFHKGLNGGTNPEQKYLVLNTDASEVDADDRWNDTAPTSTHFTVGTSNSVNAGATSEHLALLFASVDGISKVGYFDGQNSNITVTLGFQPQFLILKKVSGSGDWLVLQTKTTPYNFPWPSNSNENTCRVLRLNHAEDAENYDISYRTSTGFVLTSDSRWNTSGEKFIYYAHV